MTWRSPKWQKHQCDVKLKHDLPDQCRTYTFEAIRYRWNILLVQLNPPVVQWTPDGQSVYEGCQCIHHLLWKIVCLTSPEQKHMNTFLCAHRDISTTWPTDDVLVLKVTTHKTNVLYATLFDEHGPRVWYKVPTYLKDININSALHITTRLKKMKPHVLAVHCSALNLMDCSVHKHSRQWRVLQTIKGIESG